MWTMRLKDIEDPVTQLHSRCLHSVLLGKAELCLGVARALEKHALQLSAPELARTRQAAKHVQRICRHGDDNEHWGLSFASSESVGHPLFAVATMVGRTGRKATLFRRTRSERLSSPTASLEALAPLTRLLVSRWIPFAVNPSKCRANKVGEKKNASLRNRWSNKGCEVRR